MTCTRTSPCLTPERRATRLETVPSHGPQACPARLACDTGLVDPVVEVAAGFSSIVYQTSDGRCLKVARAPDAAVRRRREAALLRVVSEHVGVEVQSPVRELPASERWPYGAVLCPWLTGRFLSASDSPEPVAGFLRELAAVPVDTVGDLVEGYERWRDRQRQTVVEGIAALEGLADVNVSVDVLGWLHWFAASFDGLFPRGVPVSLVRGDLWSQNILVRCGQITGVLDWENAAIADPAADLPGFWYLGDDWADDLIARLRWSPAAVRRAHFYRVVRELHGAAWAEHYDDQNELADSLRKTIAVVRAVQAVT